LTWTFQSDRDVTIGAVHWSAMTRILRELVNNVIAHSEARNVDIEARFEQGELRLSVGDDGDGRDPSTWSHGLGLGGVRKRVKLLGGQVSWREREPRGIVCELRVPRFGDGGR
jgi:signal transduction histidine kinase